MPRRAPVALVALALLAPWPAPAQVALPSSAPTRPAPGQEGPKLGSYMPALDTTGLNNVDYHIDFPVKGPTTLLFFFSPGCPHCKAMIPEWNKAFASKPEGLKVLGVAMEKPPEGFFAAVPVSFPVVIARQARQMSRDINLQHVPLAVRVAPGGQVEDVAGGEVPPERVQKLFAAPAR